MATTKVTITLEDEQLLEVRKLVQQRAAKSVSGFVQRAVSIALQDAAGWNAVLGEALDRTGGPLTGKERRWADALLAPKRRRKRAA